MAKRKKGSPVVVPERSLDRSTCPLRDVVLICVQVMGAKSFDMLMTRVPTIGEEINREDRSYLVLRVQHEPIDSEGYARLGWHAFVEAKLLQPDEEPLKNRQLKRK